MENRKPNIRVLCGRCWREYILANIHYLPLYTRYKDSCQRCGYHEGYEYVEVKKRRG